MVGFERSHDHPQLYEAAKKGHWELTVIDDQSDPEVSVTEFFFYQTVFNIVSEFTCMDRIILQAPCRTFHSGLRQAEGRERYGIKGISDPTDGYKVLERHGVQNGPFRLESSFAAPVLAEKSRPVN